MNYIFQILIYLFLNTKERVVGNVYDCWDWRLNWCLLLFTPFTLYWEYVDEKLVPRPGMGFVREKLSLDIPFIWWCNSKSWAPPESRTILLVKLVTLLNGLHKWPPNIGDQQKLNQLGWDFYDDVWCLLFPFLLVGSDPKTNSFLVMFLLSFQLSGESWSSRFAGSMR